MRKSIPLLLVLALVWMDTAIGEEVVDRLVLHHADEMAGLLQDTTFANGGVVFQAGSSMIYCDSMMWLKGERVILRRNVIIEDLEYRLLADSVNYDLISQEAVAVGPYVELWSRKDSLYAVGKHAFYDKKSRSFAMRIRPTVYLKYPDSSSMIKVVADSVDYDAISRRALATGNVIISSRDISATAGRAVMMAKENSLDLFDNPVAKRGKSVISGATISITSIQNLISQINVVDSAKGEFVEAADSAGTAFDRSILKGNHLVLDFLGGQLSQLTCTGQAYSWYYPSPRGKTEFYENSVSGDTIRLFLASERLQRINVDGGAVGSYISGKESAKDTAHALIADTINYNSANISYSMSDSIIVLTKIAHVTSRAVTLDAHKITFDTRRKLIEAYSASVGSDSSRSDDNLTAHLQPNLVPVALKDKTETVYGDYLQYSTETEKGRIIQSKSKYETGFYYGENVFRANRDIFYVDQGRYTTCDANEPHFHFYSKRMKLLEGDKLLAKPVVMYINRVPVLALPFYVFPLKKGRHSGFLPFSFGNIEKGDRYIRNVGYFWSPSDYWDLKGALDYNERGRTVTFSGEGRYKVLYLLDGSISANYTTVTGYNSQTAAETGKNSWTLNARHSQEISPSFKLDADGQFQSSKDYYKDYSLDLKDRLNRNVRSHLSMRKLFGRSYAISANFNHDVDLDRETRSDNIPILTLSSVNIRPFGSGTRKADGTYERRWYHNAIISYTPAATNHSDRITKYTFSHGYNYRYIYDPIDSSITDSVLSDSTKIDSISYRSRRSFTRVDHSVGFSFPLTVARYFVLNPSASYSENWLKVWPTDQSREKKLDPGPLYRTYLYNLGMSFSTKLYGTLYPKMFGVSGLRQVLSTSVSYGYVPRLNRFPEVRAYVGGGVGSLVEASSMSVTLGQIYQAKIRKGEIEKSYELLSITSGLSYNFRKRDSAFSDIRTSYRSQAGPKISFYGEMRHAVYRLGSRRATVFSPSLRDFSFNANITLAGQRTIFDEVAKVTQPDTSHGLDSLSTITTAQSGSGWSLAATYTYSEANKGIKYEKSSYAQLTLRFNVTPTTAVTYSQSYDFGGGGTVNKQVNIVKQLHCWVGTLYWVPIGSNQGYGFRLNVIAIPSIKIDNTSSLIGSGSLQDFGR